MAESSFAATVSAIEGPLPETLLPVPAATARRHETPCGDGALVWREWGKGPVLLMLHGGTGSWWHWALTVVPLAGQRRVVIPDLPGFGESVLTAPPYTAETFAALLAPALDQVIGPSEPYDLAAFSYGSVLGVPLAVLHRDRIRSLTLVGSPPLDQPPQRVDLVKVRAKHGAERREAHRTNLSRLMFADPARIDALALAIQEWNTSHARLKSRNVVRPPMRDMLREAGGRLNAIWGERDNTAPNMAERIAVLRGMRPDVDCRLVRGAGHWVAYEAADRFNALLREMLPT